MIELLEHYITIDNDDIEGKKKYLDDVKDIIEKSYASIGGAHIKDFNELLSNRYLWKLVRKNGKIVACNIYKGDYQNRKLSLGGSDRSEVGKQSLYAIWDEDIERLERGAWGEVSDAVEHIMLKRGALPIPNEIAEKILEDSGKSVESLDPDGYHYTRLIRGTPHTKMMVGNIPEKYKESED